MINYPVPIYLEETTSTNSCLQELCTRNRLDDFACVYTTFQSAGRGQRGNVWESEKGKNLLFSVVVHPDFLEARHQFLLSQITALALEETLSQYTDGITIKWPNDIYWNDKKICGTLIENELAGSRLLRSIAGTGVNLNQERFLSDAPNPVSLKQITGRTYDTDKVLLQILDHFTDRYAQLKSGDANGIMSQYKRYMYRKKGLHAYRDANGMFKAYIKDVEPDGRLVLEDETGNIRKYLFKEVEYILHT